MGLWLMEVSLSVYADEMRGDGWVVRGRVFRLVDWWGVVGYLGGW